MSLVDPIRLNFPSCLEREFPDHFQSAWNATNSVLKLLPTTDFSGLARHSPGLKGFQWESYIKLSAIRMVRIGAALRRMGLNAGRVLDFGSYFGNFSLFAKWEGFDVDAADSYSSYGGSFDSVISLLQLSGVKIIDLSTDDRSLSRVPSDYYDAVLCLGVIEHIAHTPRPVLQMLDRVLKPGGSLIIDTPNLLYIYTRDKLASGQSIFPQIEGQFFVEPPFEGHHREYTPGEVAWMLEAIGHKLVELEMFNYSMYGLSELSGRDASFWRRMEDEPECREIIMTRSIKPL